MFLSNGFRSLNWFLYRLLILLGLRRRQQYFGTVYDSVSKQPLDPAVVKLISVYTGEVVETSVTDMVGRYGFLAAPGRYKILVKKSNYQFPSQKVPGSEDNVYNNLYHGELFDLVDDSDVIGFNIPLDPLQSDWNQQAKQEVVKFSPFLEHLLSKVVTLIYWFVLVLVLIKLYFSPAAWVLPILGIYGLLFLTAFLLPKPRLWGQVFQTGKPVLEGVLELSHPDIPGIVVAKSRIFNDGKFFMRAGSGIYILKITGKGAVEDKTFEKTTRLRIGQECVLYKNISV